MKSFKTTQLLFHVFPFSSHSSPRKRDWGGRSAAARHILYFISPGGSFSKFIAALGSTQIYFYHRYSSGRLLLRCDLKLIVEGQLNSTARMLTGRTLETKNMLWEQHSWHKFRLRSSRQLKVSLPVVASRSRTHKGTFTSFQRSKEGE